MPPIAEGGVATEHQMSPEQLAHSTLPSAHQCWVAARIFHDLEVAHTELSAAAAAAARHTQTLPSNIVVVAALSHRCRSLTYRCSCFVIFNCGLVLALYISRF